MKFSVKDIFSKCDQIRRKLRIWSQLLKKSLIENFIFCAVTLYLQSSCVWNICKNNDANSKVNFQKMRIPLFMFHSKFLCVPLTNPKLAILRAIAEGCIVSWS